MPMSFLSPPQGEQITYNYAFCHYSANPMRCHCGAETCAGLLTTKVRRPSHVPFAPTSLP